MRELALSIALLVAAPALGAEPGTDPGAALYGKLGCEGCHERAALPGMIVRPLIGLSERYTPESLSAFLAAPPEPMPDFSLTGEERGELARYLLATFP